MVTVGKLTGVATLAFAASFFFTSPPITHAQAPAARLARRTRPRGPPSVLVRSCSSRDVEDVIE